MRGSRQARRRAERQWAQRQRAQRLRLQLRAEAKRGKGDGRSATGMVDGG